MNKAFELIPLTVQAKGEVISSNIEEFREMVREGLAQINRDLLSDEDFGQAEQDAKALKTAEDAVKAAKEKALGDAESLNALFAALDDTGEEIRKARLCLENQISKRKEEVKTELAEEYLLKIDCAERLRRKTYLSTVLEAVKGKRTLDTMRRALDTAVIVANGNIGLSRKKIAAFVNDNGQSMVPDREELEIQPPAFVEQELRRRIEAKKAEDERKRLVAEAEKARQEAERLRAEAAERERKEKQAQEPPAPPAPPERMAATATQSPAIAPQSTAPCAGNDGADEEWSRFRREFLEAFRPLKAVRESLRHPQNAAKAQRFAETLNNAWKEICL